MHAYFGVFMHVAYQRQPHIGKISPKMGLNTVFFMVDESHNIIFQKKSKPNTNISFNIVTFIPETLLL